MTWSDFVRESCLGSHLYIGGSEYVVLVHTENVIAAHRLGSMTYYGVRTGSVDIVTITPNSFQALGVQLC